MNKSFKCLSTVCLKLELHNLIPENPDPGSWNAVSEFCLSSRQL